MLVINAGQGRTLLNSPFRLISFLNKLIQLEAQVLTKRVRRLMYGFFRKISDSNKNRIFRNYDGGTTQKKKKLSRDKKATKPRARFNVVLGEVFLVG